MHHRVANLREDTLHKLTTRLTRTYGTIVVEDLNVAGMGRNRRLSRRVADAASGEIRRRLTYKTRRHGTRLVVADRWFPSSKTCSRCGAVKAKLPLSVRVFECDTCGLVLDRDENAGHNLLALAATSTTRITGTGVAGDLDPALVAGSKPRGADGKTRTTLPRHMAGTGRAGGTIPVFWTGGFGWVVDNARTALRNRHTRKLELLEAGKQERLAVEAAHKPPEPVCGCTHHLAKHDKKGKCHERVEVPTAWDAQKKPVRFESDQCNCQQYVGPQPLSQVYADELTDLA